LLNRISLAVAGFGMAMLAIQEFGGGGIAVKAETSGFFAAPSQESAGIALARDRDNHLHMTHTGYDGETKNFIYYGY